LGPDRLAPAHHPGARRSAALRGHPRAGLTPRPHRPPSDPLTRPDQAASPRWISFQRATALVDSSTTTTAAAMPCPTAHTYPAAPSARMKRCTVVTAATTA